MGRCIFQLPAGILLVAALSGCASQRDAVPENTFIPAAPPHSAATDYNPASPAAGPLPSQISEEKGKLAGTGQPAPVEFAEYVVRLPDPGAIPAPSIRQAAFKTDSTGEVATQLAEHEHAIDEGEELPLKLLPPVASATSEQPHELPIDFATALAVAAGENPRVAFARQRINEAYAQWRSAEVMWIPSLRGGMNYNKHEGTIQDVAGSIIETSRGAVYAGFGAQAVGAGSPAVPGLVMNFHFRDAIFQPRVAERLLAASRQASRATTNDILFETAIAYNDLLEAVATESIARSTVANTQRLAEVTADFARAGQGLLSDADRAQAESAVAQIELRRATEGVQTASVRLARLLSEDPTLSLVPLEASVVPIELAPADCSLAELVATGLSNRPELVESRFLVAAAVERLRSERSAPLVPSVLLGLSYGGFGGGLGSDIRDFGDRMDFDAVAYWELRNLGWGEAAARAEAQSRVEQARWRQVQVMDQVASEVAEAHIQATSRRNEIELAQQGITAAQDSYRRNSERIQDALGLPIEVLQSIQALDRTQRQYVRSVSDYNRAQFRLQRALGWAIQ